MGKVKDMFSKVKQKLVNKNMYSVSIVILICISVGIGAFAYKRHKEYRQVMENQYNMAFYELVDYVQNVETFLAKSLISSTKEHGMENLNNVWREANLALSYMSLIPVSSNELSSTLKFLNQTSDYAYALSKKNMYGEDLNEEDLKNLESLYNNAVILENTLNQLSSEINTGQITWGELTKKGNIAFAQQVSNISKNSFGGIEQNLQEYAGLIYDGAFSEHIISTEKKGLTGNEIDEKRAEKMAELFIGKDKIAEINSKGLIKGDIESFNFIVKMKNNEKDNALIQISKKGGHVVLMNYNRDVTVEVINSKEAVEIGKEFLRSKGYSNMKETYYLKEGGIITANYAYSQNDFTIYPDLIKVKIALDNGEILGIETEGYLNAHYEREIAEPKIGLEEAKKTINPKLEILSEGLSIIPTKWRTEIECYEFKGKINNKDFLVYINAENGREENILMVVNTPNGTLTI